MALVLAAVAQAAPTVGEAPPDFLGKTPQGEELRISDHRGKVVMVSFWASWCGYCRQLLPVLENFQQLVDPDQLQVVVVNYKEPVRTYRTLMREFRGLSVTWTHDGDGAISDAYGVNAVPHLFVVDKYGDLAFTRRGYSEESLPRLVEQINALLAERGPPDSAPAFQAADAGAVGAAVP